jgi:catechol 2,3-dioxygenase-like lactoylglutathione lyase family enzyme
MIMGIHHTAISTPDLERLKSFYCDLFGLEEVMRFGWEQGDQLCDSMSDSTDRQRSSCSCGVGTRIWRSSSTTHPTPQPRDPQWRVNDYGITHVCFEVADIHAEFDRLAKAGMRFQNEAPIDAMGMLHAVYGFDPDGNIVELIEFPDREKQSESTSLTGAPLLNGTRSLLSELS